VPVLLHPIYFSCVNFFFKFYSLPRLFGNLIPANKKAGPKPAVLIWFMQITI
jgi:hypothetical protein